MNQRTRILSAAIAALALLAAVVASGCGGTSSGSTGGGKTISLVAYSTPKEAYAAVIKAFQATPDGKGVTFRQSFGASGEQSRAVANGLPADVVAFSLTPDVDKLVDANLVDKGYQSDKYKGFVTNSVVVLAVRKGNPKNIKSFDDLARPGVEVITPNPFTSGGAKWNIMGAYGSQIAEGKTEQQATDYLKTVFKNVAVQDKSGRESLQTFLGGKGDVAITYENEAIGAQQKGADIDYVVPDSTLLIQNPIAVTKNGSEKAKKFVAFTRSDEAQKLFAAKGYRPVNPALVDKSKFPDPPGLFTIEKFGGWSAVNKKFFDPEGIVGKIEQSLGVSTSK
jgi:sulfate/thiosulfate transport system substrate-binding protein